MEKKDYDVNEIKDDKQFEKERHKKSKEKRKIGKATKFVIALSVLGVVVIGILVAPTLVKHYFGEPETQLTSIIVKEELKAIQETSVYKYDYTKVEKFKNSRKFPWGWNIPFTEKEIEIAYNGQIKVFFDLSKCKETISDKKVTIMLPPFKISHSIEGEIVEEDNNILNPIELKDEEGIRDALKIRMEKRAIDKGVFDKGKKSAKQAIESVLGPHLKEGQVLVIDQSSKALQEEAAYIKKIKKKESDTPLEEVE
ncbi:MAG: DUF4230 domain-containing protein [Bacillota bacterium]|nr:DUF4230 domain-containing protein [Bacillota bacterium]